MSNYKDFLETSITFSDQLRRGDKVLVEVTVDGPSVLGRKTISVRDGDADRIEISVADIRAILPHQVKVGDKAKRSEFGDVYRVLHIEENFAMVRNPAAPRDGVASVYALFALKELEVVE